MSWNQSAFLVTLVTVVSLVAESASADVIRSPTETSKGTPAFGSMEVARSGPGVGGLLSLGSSTLNSSFQNGFQAPKLESDLVGSSVSQDSGAALTATELARPELPGASLLGTSALPIASNRPAADPEIASDPMNGRNVRIPEPASLTLIFAGIVGLVARQRLRHHHQPKKVEPAAAATSLD